LHEYDSKFKNRTLKINDMKNVLIISGHTDLSASVANKTILDTVHKELPEAEIVRLDSLYPDYKINVEAEQQRLVKADIIVLEFPVFWYSAPSILERWMEETFKHGFSHGSNGNKLKGKKLVLSFTTGAPASMYSHDGAMGYTIDDFLPCFKATCNLCQMEFAGYVYTGGVSYANRTTPELIEQQNKVSVEHAKRLIDLIKSL
jgi:glutathione-regulated potassium-efflux system ancillary protein KefF